MVVETASELRAEIGEINDIPTLSVASSVVELPVALKSLDPGASGPAIRDGRVIEEGTPQELLDSHGYFFQMMSAQTKTAEVRVQ